ncbi:aspartic peptidase domain-containing protein [Fimicolochytrium jonesii]|uniref:aspartic peptidase domain-containing protein n=1 Tax=Fimicolochytrium jonesii TaxID=1396493 RepID=UPI0022FF2A4F|nr:aspartic peptidase domain-containing protein [Fimicolochytrium jonesii]KAI8818238.1 aspartic peptidase domain-containing protein [Fimicolochytrium jonesii]
MTIPRSFVLLISSVCLWAAAVVGAGSVPPANAVPFNIPLDNPILPRYHRNLKNLTFPHPLDHDYLQRRQMISEDISGGLDPIFSYYGTVTFGTSSSPSTAQNFSLLFDTGSYQLWVRSTKCTGCSSSIPKFNGVRSSTYTDLNVKAPTASYADGTQTNGTYAKDKVTIAGLSVSNLKFMEVTATSDTSGLQGIMGCSYPQQGYPTTFFQSLVWSKGISSPSMGYYIDAQSTKGAITMGGVDTNRFSGALQWIPTFGLARDGSGGLPNMWFQGLTIGANYKNSTSTYAAAWPEKFLSVFDTGTSYGILPIDLADDLHQYLPHAQRIVNQRDGSTYYFVDKSSLSQCGDITLSFVGSGGQPVHLTIGPNDYLINSQNYGNMLQSVFIGNDDIKTQFFPEMPPVSAILGNGFLRKFYTVFDWGTNRTGFADAARGVGLKTNLTVLDSTTTGEGTVTDTSPFAAYWKNAQQTYVDDTPTAVTYAKMALAASPALVMLVPAIIVAKFAIF